MTTPMTNMKLGSSVHCSDGDCGTVTNVVLNPVTKKVSHIVVQGAKLPRNPTRLVPISKVESASEKGIFLNCSLNWLGRMPFFEERRYIAEPACGLRYYYFPHDYLADDYFFDDTLFHAIKVTTVPAGEMVLSVGMEVEATDGKIGTVDDLVLNSNTGEITHFRMREGHAWGEREVTIPAAAAKSSLGNVIYLKIDKKTVGQLPSVPIKRPIPLPGAHPKRVS